MEPGLEAEVERGRAALAPDDSRLVDGLVELARRDEDGQVRAAREAGALPLVEDEQLQLVVVDHVRLAHVVEHAVPSLGEEAERLVAESRRDAEQALPQLGGARRVLGVLG